jgi:phosphatidate phosphatase APP1
MKTFEFYVDSKVTTWYRTRFEIEGEDLEDAKKKSIEFVKNDEHGEISWDHLDDTIEVMSVRENGSFPTEELYDEGGNMIWNNG